MIFSPVFPFLFRVSFFYRESDTILSADCEFCCKVPIMDLVRWSTFMQNFSLLLCDEVFYGWVIGASCKERQIEWKQCKICADGVTRSNKRVLRVSIIGNEKNDATLKFEVFFNVTDGNPTGLRDSSFPVPPVSKKWKNRSVYLYATLVF
jgi:hypothetical protein